MLRLAVMVSGRGSNLTSIMDAIDDGSLDAQVSLVLSDRPSAPALGKALARGCEAIHIPEARRYESVDSLLVSHRVDLLVLAGYMRLLPEWFVDRWFGRLINIHPSLLPAFPGLHAQRQAILRGVKVTGCTVHFVDSGCDTGPIIAQAVVRVYDSDNEESLSNRILVEEHRLLPYVIGLIGQGRVRIVNTRVLVKEQT